VFGTSELEHWKPIGIENLQQKQQQQQQQHPLFYLPLRKKQMIKTNH